MQRSRRLGAFQGPLSSVLHILAITTVLHGFVVMIFLRSLTAFYFLVMLFVGTAT